MDTLLSLLDAVNFADLDQEWLILGMVLVATVLLVLTIGLLFTGIRNPMKQKIAEQFEESGSRYKRRPNDKLDNTLESLAPILAPKSEKERETIRVQLMHAGFHQSSVLSTYYAIKALSAITGIIIAFSLYIYAPKFEYLNLTILVSLTLGVFLPNYVLHKMITTRKSKLKAAVPDALDLLVVCTESGLGFNAALQRVANELAISHPEFSDELDTVCVKIKAGVEFPTAFAELVNRTGLYDIQGLVSMLSHAARVGGSLAQTLRDYTEDYRDRRNQEAEEVAAKIPTKMLFPMILFIWPCFFIVILGPAMLTLTKAFQ